MVGLDAWGPPHADRVKSNSTIWQELHQPWEWQKECAVPTRNVHLTEHYDEFIEAGVQSGRFSDASEVVGEGLRLLEQREEENKARLVWLRGSVQEGLDAAERGEYTSLCSPDGVRDFLHALRAK